METVLQDLRFALRQLRKNRAFTAVVVITLTLGIGANTAVFSVINAILLAPLPYEQPNRLAQIYETMRNSDKGSLNMSVATYLDLRERNHSFEDMAAFQQDTASLTGAGDPEQIACFSVSPHFFKVLGTSVTNGRTFTQEEGQAGKNTVALLDYWLWQHRFNGDPAMVGKTIELNRRSFTVIGILPKNFSFYGPPRYPRVDVFIPLAEQQAAVAPRESGGFNVIGRLKPGMTLAQAGEDLLRIAFFMQQEHPEYKGTKWVPQALDEVLLGEVRPALRIVLGAVICVLFVTCVNVAALLLVWRLRRQPEICVRIALGAEQSRLARQFITESLLLTLTGAGLGLALALGSFRFLTSLIPDSTPIGGHIGIDLRVLFFTLGTSVLTALLFGVLLSMPRLSQGLNQGLLEAGTRVAGRGHTRRVQSALVVAEIGLAFVLMICAGLMVRTFTGLLAVDPGFHPKNVLAASIQLPSDRMGKPAATFFTNLIERVRLVPGVQDAAVGSSLPIRGPHGGAFFEIPSRPTGSGQRLLEFTQIVSPDYFEVMGTSLREGRQFSSRDQSDSPGVVIVNQSFVRKYWPGEDAVGKHISVYNHDWQIVGVANDIREFGQLVGEIQPVVPLIYFPLAQNPRPNMQLIVRTNGTSTALINALRAEIFRLDKNQPVGKFVSMDQVLTESVWSRRAMALLISGFGGLAFLLAVTGVYGLISYTVTQRKDEFGIRLAMGARRSDLFSFVLRDGMKTVLIGVVLGLAGSILATRLVASKLFGVGPLDSLTFSCAVLGMIIFAMLACVIPARRAAQVDPIMALRRE